MTTSLALRDFFVGLGMLLVIEGIVLLGLPETARRAMKSALAAPERALRISGLVMAVGGLILIWFLRRGLA